LNLGVDKHPNSSNITILSRPFGARCGGTMELPALGRERQEDRESEASLGYTAQSKKQKQDKQANKGFWEEKSKNPPISGHSSEPIVSQ
jgi:hypothetical protein